MAIARWQYLLSDDCHSVNVQIQFLSAVWYVLMLLICLSLISRGVEHFRFLYMYVFILLYFFLFFFLLSFHIFSFGRLSIGMVVFDTLLITWFICVLNSYSHTFSDMSRTLLHYPFCQTNQNPVIIQYYTSDLLILHLLYLYSIIDYWKLIITCY